MKPSLLKYSAWISLLCVLFFSCTSSRIFVSGDEAGKLRQSFLSNSFDKITCKAKVTFHENELSGLMLIKKTSDGNFRLAFYNELGMTYLEGLIDNQGKHSKLILKNIVPALNHKSFIMSFEKSMQLLFSTKNPQISKSSNQPIHQSSNQPINQSTNLPFLPASPLPPENKDILIIQLRNGFRLELKPNH